MNSTPLFWRTTHHAMLLAAFVALGRIFEAKPGEARDIAFAWRVRWPRDKGVVMIPAG